MEKFLILIQRARSNIYVAITTAALAIAWGVNWVGTTNSLIRKDDLFQRGQVEVTVEGISEKSLRDAEDDAKRKAIEKANGLYINYERSSNEENVVTMDSTSTEFQNTQEDVTDLSITGDSDFASIDYIERQKEKDGLYHVKINAVVKLKQ